MFAALILFTGCRSVSQERVIDEQLFCYELNVAWDEFDAGVDDSIVDLLGLEAEEAKRLVDGQAGSLTAPTTVEKNRRRAETCGYITWKMADRMAYIAGVDRSSHLFFKLGIDERHDQAGRVHSEISAKRSTLFSAPHFLSACLKREGEVAMLEGSRTALREVMRPYVALCTELGQEMKASN